MKARFRTIALVAAAAAFTAPLLPSTAYAADRTATLVGSLQSELGCTSDWQPDCANTALVREGVTSRYTKEFAVPAGSFELKVAIDRSWTENYGAGGVANGANIPLVLQGPATIKVVYDDATHQLALIPTRLSGGTSAADRGLAKASLRNPLTKERFYFLMADRFANADPGNDGGGLSGGRLQTGLDPTDKGFYHGGDLRGVTEKLDYIKGLGATAIWLTPSFKNKPVQGTPGNESAGYHGYWITDFTQIDPHLGTNADMKTLIDAAHAKGMKVYFDIITNHTADVINYAERQYVYRGKDAYPYRDASGRAFDDRAYATAPTFPAMDPATSFPYTPVFNTEADKAAKIPSWLNDPALYHNRGDSTFAGESSTYGDFVGLDDLFTERPEVVKGMGDIYSTWADFGIDGFRIDTVKHVNLEFWQQFAHRVLDHARRTNPNFFMFGEVYDAKPEVMSQYTTAGRLQATLDFGFQQQAAAFAQGKASTGLRDLYAGDDYYTDSDSNAYQLPTFLGNHDMGRIAMMIRDSGFAGDELMRRTQLANSLMYLTRGQPIVYYGDEQGFMGSGGDKDARQDMFATRTQQYASEQVLGGPSGARDRYDTTAPLYRQIAELAKLRADNPGLADGAQIHRYASAGAGIFAFSRIDKATGTEYVVVMNNSNTAQQAKFNTFSANKPLAPIYGPQAKLLHSDKDKRVTVTAPPLSAQVFKANAPMDHTTNPPAITLAAPLAGDVVGARAEISARVAGNAFTEVTFYQRPVGTRNWQLLGTDDNAPHRVFHDVSGLPKGTMIEYRAVARDYFGQVSAASTYAVVGRPGPSADNPGNVRPVTQPG